MALSGDRPFSGFDIIREALVGGGNGNGGGGNNGNNGGKGGGKDDKKRPINRLPSWATRQPLDLTELLRQLSANTGQTAMPGGYVGAVQLPAFGAPGKPQQMTSMQGYGQQPGMGEARFFHQSMDGGMAPIWAYTPLGTPEKWDPFGMRRAGDRRGGGGRDTGPKPGSIGWDPVMDWLNSRDRSRR